MTKQLEVKVKFDGASVSAGSAQAGRDFEAMGKAGDQASKTVTKGIQQTTEALEAAKQATVQYTQVIFQKGAVSSEALKPYLDGLGEVTRRQDAATVSLGKTGVSAAQTAAAMRQLPAQFTDIVTSLQGGQAPLTVLLQQGGQIKDAFGGAGAATKALGGYVMGLVSPFTTAAVVAAGLSFAYYQGSKEADAYSRAIVLTGNAAGTTTGQLQAQARAISDSTGATQSAAADAVAQVAATGQVASENFDVVTRAALAMEKANVQAVEKTVDQFAALGRTPVEASIKLNEQTNFLTASVFAQIKALETQGHVSEAGALAQQTYADALSARAARITADLGLFERAWGSITGAAKGAWDAMLGVGRAQTVDGRIRALQEALAARQTQNATLGIKDGASTKGIQAELAALQATQFANQENARAVAQTAEANKLSVKWLQEGDKYLSKAQLQSREIARTKVEGQQLINAGLLTEQQLADRIAAIKDKTADSTGQSEVAGIQARTIEQQRYLELLRTQGTEAEKLTEGERLVIKIKQELSTNLTAVARAEKQRALAAAEAQAVVDRQVAGEERRLKGLRESKAAYDALVDGTRKSADSLKTQADELEASNAMWGRGRVAIEEYRLALLNKKLAEVDANPDSYRPDYVLEKQREAAEQERKLAATREAEYKSLMEKQQEYSRQVSEEALLYQEEITLIGMTAREREKVLAVRKVEVELAKRLAEIERSGATPDRKADLVAVATAAAEHAKATAAAKAEMAGTIDIINSVEHTAQQVWTNVEQGGSDTFNRIGRTIEASVWDLLYQLTLKKWVVNVTANIVSAFTGSAGGFTGSGLISSGANALGLGGMASSFGTAALGTVQGWLGMSGTAAQTSAAFAQAFGAGSATGIMSSIGAAAPYVAAAYAAYNLLSSLNGGETRSGGQYAVAFNGQVNNNRRGESYSYVGQQFNRDNSLNADGTRTAVTNGSAYLIEADGVGAKDQAVRDAVAATASSINSTLKALGSSAALNGFWAGMETSGSGRGGVFAGGSFTNGLTFGESGKGDNYAGTLYERTSTNSPDMETALANMTLDLKQATIQAFQQITDIPKAIQDIVKGKDAEALTSEAADAILTSINNQVAAVEGFRQVVDSMPIAGLKGLSFDAASGLIELSGGLETLTSHLTSYLQNYYSETERQDQIRSNLTKTLADVGLSLPATREAFKALVEAQDRETESGRKAWAALMAVEGAFADLVPTAESAAEAAAAEAEAKKRAAEEAAAAAKKAKEDVADAAMATLQRSVDAQREILNAAHQAAQEAVSKLRGVFDTLTSATRELYGETESTRAMSAAQGQAFIEQALATAQAGGALPSQDDLSAAIAAARSGFTRANYSTQEAMDRDRLVLAGRLEALRAISGTQLSAAEQQLQATQDQLDALEKVIAQGKAQIDALKGIDTSVLSVAEAVSKLAKALGVGADPAGGSGSGSSSGSGSGSSGGFVAGPVGSGSVTDGFSDQEKAWASIRNYWSSTYDGSVTSIRTIAAKAQEFNLTEDDLTDAWGLNRGDFRPVFARAGIPKFSVGTDYVSQDMIAEIHQGERIVPASYNRSDATNAELLGVMQQVLQAIYRVVTNTGLASDALQGASRGAFLAMKGI